MTVPQRVLDIMNSGEVYAFDDPEILQAQADQMELLYEFNASRPSEPKHRRAIAEKRLGGYEEGRGFVRLSYAGDADELRKGLRRMRDFAERNR